MTTTAAVHEVFGVSHMVGELSLLLWILCLDDSTLILLRIRPYHNYSVLP
jgi:hypothetical protein